MANINAKRTIRTFKDFSLALSANGGGGSVVVTELPEVGEEHTVYELQEKKAVQSLVSMYNQQMADDGVLVLGYIDYTFVFNTTEEMQETFNSITPGEGYGREIYLNYITSEDKLIGAVYVKGAWKFTETRKISSCKFSIGAIFELEDDMWVVILKEYLGNSTGTLWNDELYTFEKGEYGILLGTPTIGGMKMCCCQEELPEIPEDVPSEYVFETIPYEKIINYQLLPHNQWYFTPKGGEVTVTSYWIYTNNEWVNMDDIGGGGGDSSLHKTVFGTLTQNPQQINKLDCSLTLKELVDYTDDYTFVILEYAQGDNYWYCVIDNATLEAPGYVHINAAWSFSPGGIYWNKSGYFSFDNGIA